MEDDSLAFWMHSDSSSKENASSDSDDIPLPRPTAPSPRQSPGKRRPDPVAELQIEVPARKIEYVIVPSDDDEVVSGPARLLSCAESSALQGIRNRLEAELAALGADPDSGDGVILTVAPPPQKEDDDRTIIFELPDGSEKETVLKAGQTFQELVCELPFELRNAPMFVDGVPLVSLDVAGELLVDYSRVSVRKPTKGDECVLKRKLSFVFPNGERKKLKVAVETTFREVLEKLNCPAGKLVFDGDPINLLQKIKDNHDIEDGDQIDVKD
jgi:hypothetical protein